MDENEMKNRAASCLLGVISLGFAALTQAQTADKAAEKAVAAAEEQRKGSGRNRKELTILI
jgi:hypothetical protein